jgi:hypothetical protein
MHLLHAYIFTGDLNDSTPRAGVTARARDALIAVSPVISGLAEAVLQGGGGE